MDKKYRHILLSNDSGERLELQQAPQNWDSTKLNLVRDLVYLGVLQSISIEFDYVGDGFQFLQHHRLKYGMDANVIVRVYRNNPNEFLFEGKLNFENYSEDRKYNRFRVDVIQSSFIQKFRSREDVKLNVLNNISLDRLPVVPAALHNATIRGRQINFFTEFDGSSSPENFEIYSHTLPFLIKSSGDENVNRNPYTIGLASTPEELQEALYNIDTALYVNNLPTAQTLQLSLSANMSMTYLGEPIPIHAFTVGDIVTRFGYKVIYKIVTIDQDDVHTVIDTVSFDNPHGNFNWNYSGSVVVQPGHLLVIACEKHTLVYVYEDGDLTSVTEVDVIDNTTIEVGDLEGDRMRCEITYNDLVLTISTDSDVPDSVHPILLPHELFSNLIAQINGGEFYSDVFGREDLGYDQDGEFAYLGITTGELLRGIAPEGTRDGIPYKLQIATSMREAFSSYSSVICLGAIITDKQFRVDPLDVLFNSNVSANIGEVNDLQIVPAKEFLFNSVKCGYPKNEYEEENGRDEFNTTYQYTNSLQAVKKELDLSSKYYGDGYGIEFARRESIITTGTKDTKYDDKIFFIDLIKQLDGSLVSRRQEGILFVDGIFSPETAINLRIASGQNMLRWKKYLNVPLDKKDKVYYFQSKDKNASLNLVTTLGETIDGQDLDTGGATLFKPEERRFKCPITIDLVFAILANPLGIVHYTYKKEKFFDYLFEVDAETDKGQATWRMLGTKDSPVQVVEDVVLGNYLKYGDGLQDFIKYGDGPDDFLLYQ